MMPRRCVSVPRLRGRLRLVAGPLPGGHKGEAEKGQGFLTSASGA